MTRSTAPIDYAYCGSTNFIQSRRILRIAELVEQVKAGSRDPVVRKKAVELAHQVCTVPLDIGSMSNENLLAVAEALYLFVRDKIAYVNDPAGGYFQAAAKTLEVGAGDCDDQSILLASLLGSIGLDPILVILPEHLYVELQIGEKHLPMDPTASTASFGHLLPSMIDYFNEKYGLKFEEYLRIPIGDHVLITEGNKLVKTKTPLQMAMYLEEKAAESYNKGEYNTAEHQFLKAAKMYRDAAVHAASKDIQEKLVASSTFCLGWKHLTYVLHQVANLKDDNFHLLHGELKQAQACFEMCRPYFEKFGASEIVREVKAIENLLEGHQETLLADFFMHLKDCDAAQRHYAKARALYAGTQKQTQLAGLTRHVEESLQALARFEYLSAGSELCGATTLLPEELPTQSDLAAQLDIAPEELGRIQKKLALLTGERLRKAFVTLSVETCIPVNILEALHARAVEITLRVDYPDTKDRYGTGVRVHPEVMERLGLQKVDRARIVFGEKEHIVTVQPANPNDKKEVIKMNKMVRDVLGVNIGDMVNLDLNLTRILKR